jgi:hypothetical protein
MKKKQLPCQKKRQLAGQLIERRNFLSAIAIHKTNFLIVVIYFLPLSFFAVMHPLGDFSFYIAAAAYSA